MYIVALFLTFAMAVLGLGSVEIQIASEHGETTRTANRIATDYINQAESNYVASEGTSVQAGTGFIISATPLTSGPAAPLCVTTPGVAAPQTHAVAGADGTTCNYLGTWSITTNNATLLNNATGAGEELSQNINISAQEQRVAATISVQVTNPTGNLLATKTRTVTLRTLGTAPYVSVSDSADSHDPFVATAGTFGGTGGKAEGDPAGCNGTGCGGDTRIKTFGACPTTGAVIPAQNAMWAAWCSNQTAGLVPTQGNGGIYNPVGVAPATWDAVDASQYVNKSWNNGGDTANAGN